MTETLVQILLFAGLATAVVVGWMLAVASLPGTWLILVTAGLYAWLTPDGSRWDISVETLGVLLALAILGEALETLSAAAGVKKLGGSRRSAVLAIIGSVIGAFFFTGLIPIPVVGTVVGACVGALGGAILGELWKGREVDHALKVGNAAMWGRLVGSLVKICIASMMAATAMCSAVLH